MVAQNSTQIGFTASNFDAFYQRKYKSHSQMQYNRNLVKIR